MKRIPLTQNKVALIDDDDYSTIKDFSWCATRNQSTGNYYATTTINRRLVNLPRVLLKLGVGETTIHKNGNPLDCRRQNMLIGTAKDAIRHQAKSTRRGYTSQFKGVRKSVKSYGIRWQAAIGFNGYQRHLGTFNDELSAAKAYNKAARKLHGKFAVLNPV